MEAVQKVTELLGFCVLKSSQIALNEILYYVQYDTNHTTFQTAP